MHNDVHFTFHSQHEHDFSSNIVSVSWLLGQHLSSLAILFVERFNTTTDSIF